MSAASLGKTGHSLPDVLLTSLLCLQHPHMFGVWRAVLSGWLLVCLLVLQWVHKNSPRDMPVPVCDSKSPRTGRTLARSAQKRREAFTFEIELDVFEAFSVASQCTA